jgi:UDP-N-acetylglucosamine acyltransferase
MSIHQTAIVDPKAEIGRDCEIGPYAIIGENVKLGDNVSVGSHSVIDGWTTIGDGCKIFPHVVIGMLTQDLKYKGGKTYVEIGKNTTIREFVTIHMATSAEKKTIVGENCLLLAYSHVAHECIVGNGVIMSNGATLAGHVIVQDKVSIGGMSGVHQFCRIGKFAYIGGCSKVVQDVLPYMLGEGDPFKLYGPNTVGLERNNFPEEAKDLIKKAYKILYRSDMNVSQAVEKIKKDLPQTEEILNIIQFIAESERGITK